VHQQESLKEIIKGYSSGEDKTSNLMRKNRTTTKKSHFPQMTGKLRKSIKE
jgi:hypothetical protein